jgi:hypothetical protein
MGGTAPNAASTATLPAIRARMALGAPRRRACQSTHRATAMVAASPTPGTRPITLSSPNRQPVPGTRKRASRSSGKCGKPLQPRRVGVKVGIRLHELPLPLQGRSGVRRQSTCRAQARSPDGDCNRMDDARNAAGNARPVPPRRNTPSGRGQFRDHGHTVQHSRTIDSTRNFEELNSSYRLTGHQQEAPGNGSNRQAKENKGSCEPPPQGAHAGGWRDRDRSLFRQRPHASRTAWERTSPLLPTIP